MREWVRRCLAYSMRAVRIISPGVGMSGEEKLGVRRPRVHQLFEANQFAFLNRLEHVAVQVREDAGDLIDEDAVVNGPVRAMSDFKQLVVQTLRLQNVWFRKLCRRDGEGGKGCYLQHVPGQGSG